MKVLIRQLKVAALMSILLTSSRMRTPFCRSTREDDSADWAVLILASADSLYKQCTCKICEVYEEAFPYGLLAMSPSHFKQSLSLSLQTNSHWDFPYNLPYRNVPGIQSLSYSNTLYSFPKSPIWPLEYRYRCRQRWLRRFVLMAGSCKTTTSLKFTENPLSIRSRLDVNLTARVATELSSRRRRNGGKTEATIAPSKRK